MSDKEQSLEQAIAEANILKNQIHQLCDGKDTEVVLLAITILLKDLESILKDYDFLDILDALSEMGEMLIKEEGNV